MIDFILGMIVGAVALITVLHFSGRLSAKTETSLSTLEQRIRNLMSAMDDAMAKLANAVEAAKAKAVEDYKTANPPADVGAAQTAQETVDAEKVGAFADQISPPG